MRLREAEEEDVDRWAVDGLVGSRGVEQHAVLVCQIVFGSCEPNATRRKQFAVAGNAHDALQKLVDEYVSLAGQIVKNALGSVFAKYPGIQPLNNN